MNITLLKAVIALMPVSLLLAWAFRVFARRKTLGATLQLLGAACLLIVVLTHVAEAINVLPFMHWGGRHSAGHYLDLSSAVLGVTLLPMGALVRAVHRQ